MLFAAYGGSMLVCWARARSWRPFVFSCAALLVVWTGYRLDLDASVASSNFGQDPFNLGTSYLWADENQKAVEWLERAEGYQHGDAALYYNLGLAYARLEKMDQAKWAYQEALAKNAKMVTAHVNLGNIWFREAAYQKAIGAYQEALLLDEPAHNARANMGWPSGLWGRHKRHKKRGRPC